MDRPVTNNEILAEFAANASHSDPSICRCNGGGWILSPYDSWLKCPRHYLGQDHPEMVFDTPEPKPEPMFEVAVHPSSGIRDLYTRSGNLQWLTDFVPSVLLVDPGAKITVNP